MLRTFRLATIVAALMMINNGCAFFEREEYAEIEAVEIQMSAERPASVWVYITGLMGHPTCGAKLLPPSQERKGNTVRVTVRAREHAGVCYAAAVPFELTVLLKGLFAPGAYRVIVSSRENSLEKEFVVTP